MGFIGLEPNKLIFNEYDFSHLMVFVFLAFLILITIIFRKAIRRWPYERLFRYITVWLVIVFELSYKVWIFIKTGDIFGDVINLDLCAISLYLSWWMFLTKNEKTREQLSKYVYLYGLGALAAYMIPTFGHYGPDHFRFYDYFITHGFIMWSGIYVLFVYGYTIEFKAVKKAYLYLLAMVPVNMGLNFLFDSNFMFLNHKPDVSSPLDMMGEWPVYVFGLIILVAVLFLIAYLPWGLYNRFRKEV